MNTKHIAIIVGSSLFILFLLLSFLVHKNTLTQFDFNMTIRLQDHIPRKLDQLFSLFSLIGRFEITTSLLVLFLLFRRKLKGIVILIAYGAIHFFELYGKYFVTHKPPPHFMLRTDYPVNLPQFYISADNSYPSGHAARALFVTTFLGIVVTQNTQMSKNMKMIFLIALCLYDLIMVISRPYLGEHWTTDVIGGSLLGASFAFLVKRFI